MSFLLPPLRHTFRTNVKRFAYVVGSHTISTPRSLAPLPAALSRSYARNSERGLPQKNSQPPQTDPLSTQEKSIEDDLSKLDAKASGSQLSPDALGGDVPAAPGSILSQYTIPQESALETSSDSGSDLPPKREEYISSTDRKRERLARIFTWGFVLGLIGGGVYLGRPLENDERQRLGWGDLPSGHSPTAYLKRFQKRGKSMLAYFNEPAFEKLLPPPPPEPYARPYTLLLDLDDLLVHAEWSREHGWRTAKRPGLDYFLGYLSQYYEIVIFTTQYAALATPLVMKLDPYHTQLSGAIFRESTRYIDGKVVKDLSYLNRDLEKVILIDTNPDACMLQPENAIIIEKWKGEIGDKGLVALIPFLEYLASQNFKDVRPVLTEYKEAAVKRHISIPDEFARRETLARQALQKTLKPVPSTSPTSFISRLFGLRTLPPVQAPNVQAGDIVTPLDLQRQQAVEGYEAMKKWIDEHGDEILQEDKKREQQFVAEQKTSLMGFMARLGGAPPPDSVSPSQVDK